jgi:uncharacterized DUF497 family protein
MNDFKWLKTKNKSEVPKHGVEFNFLDIFKHETCSEQK